jgi:hypothetical protein
MRPRGPLIGETMHYYEYIKDENGRLESVKEVKWDDLSDEEKARILVNNHITA